MWLRPQLSLRALCWQVALRQPEDKCLRRLVDSILIDGDPTGNTPTSYETVENCVEGTIGVPQTLDIVVGPVGIPAEAAMIAFEVKLIFQSSRVRIDSVRSDLMLNAASGSVMWDTSTPTDLPNMYVVGGLDIGTATDGQYPDEYGSGVLARVTVTPLAQTALIGLDREAVIVSRSLDNMIAPGLGSAMIVTTPGACDVVDPEPDNCPGNPQSTAGRYRFRRAG